VSRNRKEIVSSSPFTRLSAEELAAEVGAALPAKEMLSVPLLDLNIDIDLDIVDSQTRKQRDAAGQFDMYFSGWIQDFPDPENWIDGLWNTDGALAKRKAYSNPELDQLFKANKYEPNTEKRLAAYKQMQDIVSKSVGMAILLHESNNYMVKPKLGGAQPTNNDALLPGDWAAETWYMKKS